MKITIKIKKSVYLFLIIIYFSLNLFAQQKVVAVHFSNATDQIESEKMLEKITYWELFLLDKKINYKVVYDRDIEAGLSPNEYNVIIFPFTKALSNNSFRSINNYLNDGGSIIAFGEFGLLDEKNIPAGTVIMESLFGFKVKGNIEKSSANFFIDIKNYYPIIKDVLERENIQVNSKNLQFYIENINHKNITIGSLKRNSSSKDNGPSMIISNPDMRGKYFWSAVDPMDITGSKDDMKSIENLFENCINWFNGNEFLWIEKNQQSHYESFIIFEFLGKINNSEDVLRIVEECNLSPGFIIPFQNNNIDDLKALSSNGELILHVKDTLLDSLLGTQYDSKSTLQDKLQQIYQITGRRIVTIYWEGGQITPQIVKQLKRLGVNRLFVSDYLSIDKSIDELNIVSLTQYDNYFYKTLFPENEFIKLSEFYVEQFHNQIFRDGYYIGKFLVFPGCIEDDLNEFKTFINMLSSENTSSLPLDSILTCTEFPVGLDKTLNHLSEKKSEIILKNNNRFDCRNIKVIYTSDKLQDSDEVKIDSKGRSLDYLYYYESGLLEVFIDSVKQNQTISFDVIYN